MNNKLEIEDKDLIMMHLMHYLRETGQWGEVRWDAVMAYCIGYYDEITMDHVHAIWSLEWFGAIKMVDNR